MSSAPGSPLRNFSSQMIDSMSRWLVGLVHQQDVGRPSSTRAIATRIFQPPESVPRRRRCVVVEAEAVQHLARLRLEAVAAQVLVFLLHLAEAGEDAVHVVALARVGHVVLQRLELVVQVAEAAAAGNGFVEHRAAGHLLDVLPEVADGEALRHRHVALVGRFLADDHPEERGLAGAVRADEPTFSPGLS
jgi:hypothetical protein